MLNIIKLPGLIDIHVHLRDPGQTHKEDFFTGTSAALSGGVTTIFDMPNNLEPIFTYEKLIEKMEIAKQKAACDWGLYFGTDGKNISEFEKVKDQVVGLKVYLNITTGKLIISDDESVEDIFKTWPKDKMIVIHAEGERIDLALNLGRIYDNKIHITHVGYKNDLIKVINAKNEGLNITCDTTPNYLFLSQEQISGKNTSGVAGWSGNASPDSPDGEGIRNKGFYSIKPPIGTKTDQDFLWQNLKYIDCIATDHAPHTNQEKRSDKPPSGMPGLETMLPLLLTAVKKGRLTKGELIRLTNTNPQKIFGFKQADDTYIEVDLDEKYTIENKNLKTKCGWSPFEGWEVHGRVKRTFIRGVKVFEDGKVVVNPGFGKNIA